MASETPAVTATPSDTHGLSTKIIIILGALTAFSPMAIDMYLPAFPVIEHELAAEPGTMPRTLAVFLVGLAIGQLVFGPFSDRFGRRLPLVIGAIAFSAAAILCTFSRTLENLMIARFLMGLGGSTGMIIARAIVRDRCDETTSARIYSLMMLVMGVAPVLAPLVGEQLLHHFSWHSIFWVLSAFGVCCAASVIFALPETLPPERRRLAAVADITGRYWSMLTDKRFIGYGLSVGCSAGVLFAYIAGSPFAYMNLYQVTPFQFTLYFASNAIGLFAAAQLNRVLLPRFGPHRILRFGFIGNALAGAALMSFSLLNIGGFTAFFTTLFLCVATLGIIMPNAAAIVMKPFGKQAGSASALLGTLQYGVGAIAGAAVSRFANGTTTPMAATISVCGLAGVCIVMISERLKSAE